MSDIGTVVLEDLLAHGIDAELVDFPQNVFRDFPGYRRELLKAAGRLHPSTVIPIGDTVAISRLLPEIPARVTVDRQENITLLSSKVSTYKFASTLGIPQPALHSFGNVPDGRRVIFKRDVSFGGSGVHLPKDNAALANLIAHENGTPYLIEDYIEGNDLSVDCLRIGQYFRAGCYISTSRGQSMGPSAERVATDCPAAVEYSRKILDSLDYQGVCGLDFRLTASGEVFLLECNPRFTGGLRTQLASGFDIPYLLHTLWR